MNRNAKKKTCLVDLAGLLQVSLNNKKISCISEVNRAEWFNNGKLILQLDILCYKQIRVICDVLATSGRK